MSLSQINVELKILSDAFKLVMDAVNGNCYTFNHHTRENKYQIRRDGKFSGTVEMGTRGEISVEGLRLRVGDTANETIPWDEKESAAVYIYRPGVAMTSESPHYAPRPREMTEIRITPVCCEEINGKYEKCRRKTSIVSKMVLESDASAMFPKCALSTPLERIRSRLE